MSSGRSWISITCERRPDPRNRQADARKARSPFQASSRTGYAPSSLWLQPASDWNGCGHRARCAPRTGPGSGIVEESLGHSQVPVGGAGRPIVWTQTRRHGVAGPVRGSGRRPARSAGREGRWSLAGRAKSADRAPVGRRGGSRRDGRSGCRAGPIEIIRGLRQTPRRATGRRGRAGSRP